ncbi:MAG: hypothetical protein RH917_13045 [Lacipirellulaceae bacterium]
MDAHQILDALSASFFALLGIWAAVVRRHWFLRFSVVCICLLSALLIPAYEVVIEFGLLVTVIVTGVWLARKKPNWRPQFSLETALLLTVVVAVISAVAAKAPELSAHTWAWMIVNGVAPALLALGCLWLVFGRARLLTRLIVTALGFVPFVSFYHFLRVVETTLSTYLTGGRWQEELLESYKWDAVSQWVVVNAPILGLAITIILASLITAKASGWFASQDEQEQQSTSRWQALARTGLVASLLAVVVPLVYVFYRLLTPPELPTVELPVPNGYDDFATAGAMIKGDSQIMYSNWQSISDEKRGQLVRDWEPVLSLAQLGLKKECYWPLQADGTSVDEVLRLSNATYNNFFAILFSLDYESRLGSASQAASHAAMLIEYELKAGRGTETLANWFYPFEGYGLSEVEAELPRFLSRLTAEECEDFSARLTKLREDIRPVNEKITGRRIAEANRNWMSHLNVLLTEWSGRDPFSWEQRRHRYWLARYRVMTVQVMLQSHWLKHGVLPQELRDLENSAGNWFLDDPFSDTQLAYVVDSKGNFTLLSVGNDGKTDPPGANPIDDIIVTGPAKSEDQPESKGN